METRFSHLYKRDSSVSMIRVKMSRRRSQTQKENREKMQNRHRQLDQLPELECSLDVSKLEKSVLSQENGHKVKTDKNNSAVQERRKMLERFKENKALQKEKERREREKKGAFKIGLYHPQPLGYLSLNPVVPSMKKTTENVQSTRVTRSMKQQLQTKKPAEKQLVPKKAEPPSTRANKLSAPANTRSRTTAVEPGVRAPTTRSTKTTKAVVTTKSVVKPGAELRPPKTKSANQHPAVSPLGHSESVSAEKKGTTKVAVVNPPIPKEEKVVEEANVTPVSFAPQGFVFQPPSGLRPFQPTPLSPHSADAFLSPSSFSCEPQKESTSSVSPSLVSSSNPIPLSPPPCMSEPSSALVSEYSSPIPPASSVCTTLQPPASASSPPSEPEHDVPYFRAVMANETERLTQLSEFWELRFDDQSIPEELRDQMRTAVGQARLLMKERFSQFTGLVNDCEFCRGEKITTCTDLQGFWDMVYFQVEDVNKKFNALKEAEARGWQEEIKPVVRQKKVVKKPPVAGGKTGAGVGASVAAKSRLAAVKAAMKAKQAAAAKPAETSDKAEDNSALVSDAHTNTLAAPTIVFHGGFFQVESPIKVVGVVRRSSRLSAAPVAQCSPQGSKFSTPARQQRSAAIAHSSRLPCSLSTPKTTLPSIPSSTSVAHPTPSVVCTPKQHVEPLPCSSRSLYTSPEQYWSAPSEESHTPVFQPEHDTRLGNNETDLVIAPVDQMNHSEEIKAHYSPCQSQKERSLHLPEYSGNAEINGSAQDCAMMTVSQFQTEVNMCYSESQEHAMSFTCSPSACKTSPGVKSVENCVSVSSSPCMIPTTPQQIQVLTPAPFNKIDSSESKVADCQVTENQDSEVCDGLDIEQYLQPTAQCNFSPGQSIAMDTFLHEQDVEMGSPQAQAEPVQDTQRTDTALPGMAPLVVTPWTEEMIADQLLFTPEQRVQVRPSVCERDLMMFTPPDI